MLKAHIHIHKHTDTNMTATGTTEQSSVNASFNSMCMVTTLNK